MSDQRIETVAIAIRTVVANRAGRGLPWNRLNEHLREEYRAEAKAAIEADEEFRGREGV